jgi:hypothetical protein
MFYTYFQVRMWYKIKTNKTLILHLNKIYKGIYNKCVFKIKSNFVEDSCLQD